MTGPTNFMILKQSELPTEFLFVFISHLKVIERRTSNCLISNVHFAAPWTPGPAAPFLTPPPSCLAPYSIHIAAKTLNCRLSVDTLLLVKYVIKIQRQSIVYVRYITSAELKKAKIVCYRRGHDWNPAE
jgi:hypothetical protein